MVKIPLSRSQESLATYSVQVPLAAFLMVWLILINPFFCLKHGSKPDLEFFHTHHRASTLVIVADNLVESTRNPMAEALPQWLESTCRADTHSHCTHIYYSSPMPGDFGKLLSQYGLPLTRLPSPVQPIFPPPLTPPKAA